MAVGAVVDLEEAERVAAVMPPTVPAGEGPGVCRGAVVVALMGSCRVGKAAEVTASTGQSLASPARAWLGARSRRGRRADRAAGVEACSGAATSAPAAGRPWGLELALRVKTEMNATIRGYLRCWQRALKK